MAVVEVVVVAVAARGMGGRGEVAVAGVEEVAVAVAARHLPPVARAQPLEQLLALPRHPQPPLADGLVERFFRHDLVLGARFEQRVERASEVDGGGDGRVEQPARLGGSDANPLKD